MKIKFRKIIYKFPGFHRLCGKIVDYGNLHFYKNFCKSGKNIYEIQKLKGIGNGKRCFIVGNGPSLTMSDLNIIKNEDCFAANLVYKIFDDTNWRPKYYFIQDRYADTGTAVDTLDLPYIFIGDYFWRKRNPKNPKAICFHCFKVYDAGKLSFSEDLSKGVYDYCTITFSMIQAAVYMGYKEIYLIGMDHSFALTYDGNGNVIENNTVKSHVFEDKNPKEVVANVEGMNKAYICAREYAKKHGIQIVNCTRGGKLEWFSRKPLEEVL